jgi:thiol-activated cytolysin
MKIKLPHLSEWPLLAVPILVLLFSGCERDRFDEGALDEYLKTLPSIASQMPVEKAASLISTADETTSEYIYHTDFYEVAAGYDEQIVLNPQTDVIYPGALVKGESILNGTYTLIPAKRKPITISTSLTGSGKVSVVVDNPKLSTIREAVNNLMNQDYNVPPANMGFTIEQAYSEQQLDLSLRASYKGGVINVKGGFDFSNKQIKTRLVAKFIQSYYTIDMDLPDQPSDLFAEDVDRSLFGIYMPMYVSTVTFGRIALFTIESELSETDVKTFLQASYASVNAAASGEFDQLKAKSTMKVYILGGSGGDAGATINGFDDFKNYIKSGGNYSKTSPGAPISYKLRYIKDNSIGKIVFAASYPVVTAIPRTDNIVYDITTHLYSLNAHANDAGGNLELYGFIYSWPKSLGESVKVTHFSQQSNNWLSVPENGVTIFSENTTTKRLWTDMKQTDAIMIRIELHEVDDFPDTDDHYDVATFEVPVSEIVTSVIQGQNFDKYPLRVVDGSNYIDFTMRFSYIMRRTSK